jgi:hypothetical protein
VKRSPACAGPRTGKNRVAGGFGFAMPQRFFKLREAEEILPLLEKLLNTAIGEKKKLEDLETAFTGIAQHILLRGGVLVDRAKIAKLKIERNKSAAALQEALAHIESSGCLVKDLDTGLVDFPFLLDQREVYLCWKLGEPAIGFWHGTDEGFDGRKPIDKKMFEGEEERPN